MVVERSCGGGGEEGGYGDLDAVAGGLSGYLVCSLAFGSAEVWGMRSE